MAETPEQRILALEKVLSSQPRSPLFAQLATYYLDADRAQDALNLCDSGLAYYPFYTTGHLIKGKTLLALNMRSEARREFEFVHQMLPLNDAVNRLLTSVPVSPEESLGEASPPAESSTETITTEAAEEQPAPAGGEPQSPEPATDQWMSQFTDDTPQAAGETGVEAPAVPAEEPATSEPPLEEALPTETTEDSFGLSTSEQTTETSPEDSALSGQEEGEPFEQFAEQKRGELFGMENSMSLDEYLAEGAQESGANSSELQTEAAADPFAAQDDPQSQTDKTPQDDPFAALAQAEPESPSQETPSDDPFAALIPAEPESPSQETPSDDPFAALIPVEPESPSQETPSDDPFAALIPVEPESPPQEPTNEDPFAQMSAMNAGGPPAEESKDQIEEIAEKLKDAKKITPVINLSDRTSVSPSESETPAGTGFVTPTLAEIYAKQGWYDDAIKAYKTLAANKPSDREKYEARIAELEDLKRQQEGS